MTAEQQKRVEEIRAAWTMPSPLGCTFPEQVRYAYRDIPFLLDLLREQQAERIVKVKIGAGALTRDLVWCECGRGISATGNWVHCPKCGGKIDQESYREATRAAFANGLSGHHDADLINQIAELQAELKYLASVRDGAIEDREHLVKEIARLREALEGIVAGAENRFSQDHPSNEYQGLMDHDSGARLTWSAAAKLAKAALAAPAWVRAGVLGGEVSC